MNMTSLFHRNGKQKLTEKCNRDRNLSMLIVTINHFTSQPELTNWASQFFSSFLLFPPPFPYIGEFKINMLQSPTELCITCRTIVLLASEVGISGDGQTLTPMRDKQSPGFNSFGPQKPILLCWTLVAHACNSSY
jgi:hypothetical protein